jgi:hypothetical protein
MEDTAPSSKRLDSSRTRVLGLERHSLSRELSARSGRRGGRGRASAARTSPNVAWPKGSSHSRAEVQLRAALDRLLAELATYRGSFAAQTTRHAPLQDFSERMMGLEPTTFCMASASDRSLPFASVRSNRLFAGVPVQTETVCKCKTAQLQMARRGAVGLKVVLAPGEFVAATVRERTRRIRRR